MLLSSLLDELQAWDAAVASGAAALSALQRAVGELDNNSSSGPAAAKETVEVYQRLLQLAPSFQLEAYIQQQQQQAHKQQPTASDAASHIHEAVATLRDAVASAQEHLTALQHTCGQYQDTVLLAPALQLQDIGLAAGSNTDAGAAAARGLVAPAAAADAGDAGNSQEASAAGNNAGATDTAVVETGSSEAPPPPLPPPTESAEAETAPSSSKGMFEPEEVALLMDAVLSGMERDLQWMEAAVDGISLETTPEELSTLSTYWQLQPFTNEAAVATLVEAAVVAAAAEDAGAAEAD